MSPTSYQTAPPRDILFKWWTWVDSNYRPHAYQACALTNWATGPDLVTNYKVKNKFISTYWYLETHLVIYKELKTIWCLKTRYASCVLQLKLVSKSCRVICYKEVIQPQVLLQLPCYDFTPIINHTVVTCLPCGLAQLLLVQPTFVMWRAVCTRPGNVFTAAFWSAITSDSNFMKSSCRLQSELRMVFSD